MGSADLVVIHVTSFVTVDDARSHDSLLEAELTGSGLNLRLRSDGGDETAILSVGQGKTKPSSYLGSDILPPSPKPPKNSFANYSVRLCHENQTSFAATYPL